MRRFAIFAWLMLVGAVLLAVPAVARCENGAPPSYDDIRAIKFEHWDCASPPATNRACLRYVMFVSNWERDQDQVAEYSQFNVGAVGHYELSVDAKALISILQRYDFFELSPPNVLVTDTPYSALTVKRCAVVTRIAMPAAILPATLKMSASYYATMGLLGTLDEFVREAHKRLLSPKPDEEDWDWDSI
jgi:hypothetical protein